jgi:glyoxylase-like metal-dependent hydrolase (beta-lactamase superfamily II)
MSLMFRSLRVADTPYLEQLRERGVDPDRVERVVMTHLHVDHTSGMRLLPAARFTIAADEWGGARKDGARGGFVSHHLPPESRVDLVDPESDGEQHGPFRRTLDLLGDGSIRLVSTPGHTPGHMSVLVRTEGDRQVLLAGDAAYTLRSIEEQRLPLLTVDDERYARSLAELKAFTEDDPDAIVVPSHDPDAWRRVDGQSATSPSTSALNSRSTLR